MWTNGQRKTVQACVGSLAPNVVGNMVYSGGRELREGLLGIHATCDSLETRKPQINSIIGSPIRNVNHKPTEFRSINVEKNRELWIERVCGRRVSGIFVWMNIFCDFGFLPYTHKVECRLPRVRVAEPLRTKRYCRRRINRVFRCPPSHDEFARLFAVRYYTRSCVCVPS